MTTPDILSQIQQAIHEERAKRKYNVVVEQVRKSYGIAGVPIPAGLQAYVATTTCTEQHEDGHQCIWSDFAFIVNGNIHVVLQNDLSCPGLSLEESVKVMLESFQEIDKEEQDWQHIVDTPHVHRAIVRLADEARHDETEEGGFDGEVKS